MVWNICVLWFMWWILKKTQGRHKRTRPLPLTKKSCRKHKAIRSTPKNLAPSTLLIIGELTQQIRWEPPIAFFFNTIHQVFSKSFWLLPFLHRKKLRVCACVCVFTSACICFCFTVAHKIQRHEEIKERRVVLYSLTDALHSSHLIIYNYSHTHTHIKVQCTVWYTNTHIHACNPV